MASSEILKEFLVAVGWKNDEVAQKKVFESVENLGKGLLKLSIAAEAAAIGVVAAMARVSQSFEDAYYAASRSNSSIQELKAFQYAASQAGSSAEEAASAVANLAQKARESPGYAQLVQKLTGDKGTDWTKQTVELLAKLHEMPQAQAQAYAGIFGLSQNLLLTDPKALAAGLDEYNAKAKVMGINLKKLGEDGKSFSQQYRSLTTSIGLIADTVISKLVSDPSSPLQKLNDYLVGHGAQIADILAKVGAAFLKIFDALVEALPKIDDFVEKHGGWEVALTAIGAVLLLKVVPGLNQMVGALGLLTKMPMPAWLLAMMGIGGGYLAGKAIDFGVNKGEESAGMSDMQRKMQENPGSYGFENGPVGRAYGWVKRKLAYGNNTHKTTYHDTTNYTGSNANVLKQAAEQLGTTPKDLATVIGYETEGTFSPHIWGGKGGNYMGLIQMGGPERAQFGANDKQSFAEQMPAVVSFLKTRGFKPGMGLLDLYSTINAGRPGLYGASDGYGTVRSHVDRMQQEQAGNVRRFLGATEPPSRTAIQSNPFGSLNSGALHSLFTASPLGTMGSNDNSKSVTINDNSHTAIHGVSDPTSAAAQVGARKDRTSSMLLKNMQSAIG